MTGLTTDMKSSLALMIAWVIFLVVGIALAVVTGPVDVFALLSLAFAIPYLIFFYYGLKVKPWAFLGASLLSVVVILLIPFALPSEIVLLWESMFAALLSALVAVESFKGYLQTKGTPSL